VVSQQLAPKSYEPGRVLVCEVLIPNMAIRNLIREEKVHQVYSAMQSGQDDSGMQTMNQNLVTLVKQGTLSKVDALEHSPVPEEIVKMLATIPDRR
jgi:twitching motility protein PilT